mmetsp:Transcript_102583/g.289835  ORF Transcript_102583/g.289835 Transcript_102583/m.289835 type:complete len:207 (+) Transcript_102583:355-975(+)
MDVNEEDLVVACCFGCGDCWVSAFGKAFVRRCDDGLLEGSSRISHKSSRLSDATLLDRCSSFFAAAKSWLTSARDRASKGLMLSTLKEGLLFTSRSQGRPCSSMSTSRPMMWKQWFKFFAAKSATSTSPSHVAGFPATSARNPADIASTVSRVSRRIASHMDCSVTWESCSASIRLKTADNVRLHPLVASLGSSLNTNLSDHLLML